MKRGREDDARALGLRMVRMPRENVEDGIYHVYARGNGKQAIFLDEADRAIYLRMLGKEAMRRRWRCLSYCLMGNHLHLLVETPLANLSPGMQRLQSRYARVFNDRHNRVGHVFQGRFGAARVTTDEQLWMTAVYIARNPVAAAFCARPEHWRWSSYAATIGARSAEPWLDTARLIDLLAATSDNPLGRYKQVTLDT